MADLLVDIGHDPANIRTERFGPTHRRMTMSSTNVTADDAPWVDGNALAGPLGEIIGTDPTVAELTCAGCRTTRPLAAMRVFDRAPGLVARCPDCEDVVMRVVRTT
ncbi:hypothetical protein KBX63_34910, partial [Micromonospora sp. U21]